MGDYYFTPFASDSPMYGVEVHANILHTLLEAGPIYPVSLGINLLTVFLLALLSMFIYQALRPIWGFASLVVIAAAFFMITTNLFNGRSIYVETVYPLMALSGSYITALVYNFVVEQRNRQRVTRIFGRYVAPQVVDQILTVGEET